MVIRSLFLLFLLSGCATSGVLIAKDDAVFDESQRRLERTTQLVSAPGVSTAERALFLQAEGFYRYRYEPPSRSNLSYLTEIAAAATDFPALQSLSGSLSLLDLRLRASDSAVQLWETLLARYPDSKLRPLTLYRLGWAYRNASAEGLPRRAPLEPLDQLIKENPGTDLAKLAAEAQEVPWKSKDVATTRSLIPGGGQIYVGETKSGVIRLSVAALATAAIIYPIYAASRLNRETTWDKDWPLLAAGLGGLIVLSVDYTTSFEEAMRGVVEWNERQESEFNRTHPGAP